MKDMEAGFRFEFRYTIPKDKTVPHLYPEAEEFQVMPEVFATGYMVGLFEWACVRALKPFLDWPKEQTVGTHVDFNHIAATPPGLEVVVKGELVEVDGRKLKFQMEAYDNIEKISEGTHERFVIDHGKFDSRAREKALKALGK
ncbi:MAG TPA: thioesterase [Nitrospirae bacterium]|nr:thioesterase [Nitrospirota bacterium]